MSIFKIEGVEGTIETRRLPSGMMVVSGPRKGPLEQVMFNVCSRFKEGRKAQDYGGWIVPSNEEAALETALAVRCRQIS